MAASTETSYLRRANFRLCRLCIWPTYAGLGFTLENTLIPPHMIRIVESNSPAAAGGLKILDLILAVNNQDVSTADYKTVTQAIKNARDSNDRMDLLVIEKRYYEPLKRHSISFNPRLARIIEAPTIMPRDYMNFPKYTPRTCEIRLSKTDKSFGFEVVDGHRDIGASIQEVFPNTPASRTSLRQNDRILEIDDKFVDNKASTSILNKLAKTKKKRRVKLYVVDTKTYEYFQENQIPLTSKQFRKSTFAQRQSNTSQIVTTQELHQDDIRLCTINRAYAGDAYGIELIFHRKDRYHSIELLTGRDNRPSNAVLAGVKTNDHLIEINGENIQYMSDEQVKQRIRAIQYPQPLQILVADSATYNHYKQQNKRIHSRLTSVKKLPGNSIARPPSPHREHRRNCKLHRIPGFSGFGLTVNSNLEDTMSHKITQIVPCSPAAQQGLRVGDYIITVNDKNVENMSAFDFKQFLRTSAQNAERYGNPLVLQVINEDSYQSSSVPDDISSEHSTTDSSPIGFQNENRTSSISRDNTQVNSKWADVSIKSRLSSDDKPTPGAMRRPSLTESETSNNVVNLVPSDPSAFEASFCRRRQAVIDDMSYRQAINSWNAKRLPDVVKLIIDFSKGKRLIDRAWIVFYWVSQNIEYDVEAYFSGNIRHQTPEDVFASGKGVCDAFGTIFETLCTAVQIECKKISGYAKGYGWTIGRKPSARTNHAWNVIRLEGHWYLVDSTWGEGFLDTNNCHRRKLNPFYFLVRPEQMIYRHFPEDPKWQLLMSPISMDDFVRLPYVEPTFFEHDLDVIYPRYSDKASFNSSLGLAEVLVQAPSDTVLLGNIEHAESGKIKNGCLIHYDTNRQQWQCLFAPQQGGFHTLTLFADREKQAIKDKTDSNKYSCAIKFGLHVPTDFIEAKTFPLTYTLFTERKCQIFEPLDGVLKSGSKVTIHCRIPGASCARLLLDGNWLPEDLIKDGIFKRQITVPQKEVKIYVQFPDKQNSSSYDGLIYYSVR